MTNEFIKKLEEYGFKIDNSGRGILSAFSKPTYGLVPNMLVQGSHATDIASVHYSDEEEINGFCYYSSLMEELAMRFPKTHNIEGIIKKLNKYSDTELKIKFHNGYAFVVSECDEQDLHLKTIDYCISDILKSVGSLDYLLQQRLSYLQTKELKNNKH